MSRVIIEVLIISVLFLGSKWSHTGSDIVTIVVIIVMIGEAGRQRQREEADTVQGANKVRGKG